MAYHNISGQAATKAEFHALLKSFLVDTCGWTLYDDRMTDAQPSFVLRSSGESGREDIYIQYLANSTDRLAVKTMLAWNATTHAAVRLVDDSGNSYVSVKDATSFLYWVFADMDRIVIATRVGTTYYLHYAGLINRFWGDGVAVTLDGLAPGSNLQVPVDDASGITAGRYCLIKDSANAERVLVSAVDAVSNPNRITLESVVGNYTTGARIGEDPQPVMSMHSGMTFGTFSTKATGSDGSYYGHLYYLIRPDATLLSNTDPEDRYGLTIMWPVHLRSYSGSDFRGELKEFYAIGAGAGLSEDTITLGAQTYRIFSTASGSWAVRES